MTSMLPWSLKSDQFLEVQLFRQMEAGEHNTLSPFVPEKILFCIDLCNEVNGFEFSKNKSFTRLDLLKHMMKMFVQTKQKMNPKHEFGIAVLTEGAFWYQDFTTDVDLFMNRLSSLKAQGDYPVFNISSVFDSFLEKVRIPQADPKRLPDYLYRMIFFYSRSHVVPEWIDGKESVNQLLASPHFFFDVFYVHEKPDKANQPQDIYDLLSEIDRPDENSYVFETHSSLRRVYLNFTLLLANPLQRPEQDEFATSLGKKKKKAGND